MSGLNNMSSLHAKNCQVHSSAAVVNIVENAFHECGYIQHILALWIHRFRVS
jgi:hypothetical protein